MALFSLLRPYLIINGSYVLSLWPFKKVLRCYKKCRAPGKAITSLCKEYGLDLKKIKKKPDLITALEGNGIQNPALIYEVALNRVLAEIDQRHGIRFLDAIYNRLRYEHDNIIKLIQDSIKLWKSSFTQLLPLENVLGVTGRVPRRAGPMFFRKTGPLAVDFEGETVFRRPEVQLAQGEVRKPPGWFFLPVKRRLGNQSSLDKWAMSLLKAAAKSISSNSNPGNLIVPGFSRIFEGSVGWEKTTLP